jgi:hypothetical protein
MEGNEYSPMELVWRVIQKSGGSILKPEWNNIRRIGW